MIDASTMLGSLMQSFPGFENLLNLLVALIGLIFTGMAILKFTQLESGHIRLITPFMYLFAGVALFNFGSSADSFLQTVYGPSTSVHNLLSYSGGSSGMPEQSKMFMTVLIASLRLYGYFTFARGWISVRRIGDANNGSDEPFKAAMIRIFAGVGLINIVGTVNVVSSTLGFGKVI